MSLLRLRDLKHAYRLPGGGERPVLDVPSFELGPGEQAALAGTSGSGKTTLLNAIAGILRVDAGEITIDGTELTGLSESRRDRFRAEHLGYVFQTFNLLQGYTALENVLLGMTFGKGPDRAHAQGLLERLDLGSRAGDRPRSLSIGQQQRVALARALANRPKLVLADEPTGNLDPDNARRALELMRETCRAEGAALLLVSHDRAVLDSFERVDDLAALNRAAAGATA